nr:unnamed protein product [Callosobruchus analis]
MVPEDSKYSNKALFNKDNNRGRKRNHAFSEEELAERKRLWYRLFNKYSELSKVEFKDCRVMDVSAEHFLDHCLMSTESGIKKNVKLTKSQVHLINYVENSLESQLRILLLNRSICSHLGEEFGHMYWHSKIIAEMSSLRMDLPKKNLIEYIKICDTINRTCIEKIMGMNVKALENNIIKMRRKSIPAHKIVNEVANPLRSSQFCQMKSTICYKEMVKPLL